MYCDIFIADLTDTATLSAAKASSDVLLSQKSNGCSLFDRMIDLKTASVLLLSNKRRKSLSCLPRKKREKKEAKINLNNQCFNGGREGVLGVYLENGI